MCIQYGVQLGIPQLDNYVLEICAAPDIRPCHVQTTYIDGLGMIAMNDEATADINRDRLHCTTEKGVKCTPAK